ncbi:hypothetical protein BKA70DRAFT_1251399 [Coprinopsis sp. MPI-PUGE-AT-0042]|nr:hypothetical protein BKA70DRAFT_1251399 [Coprinopsis sp. MPI-PUGE-AT-0042]
MTRSNTRSSGPQQSQHQLQRKRKRNSSPGQSHASKLQRTDGDDDIHPTDRPDVFLDSQDAQKILDVLELSDTQGLLDRVFPSAHSPDALVSLRTLLSHPAEHPLVTIKAAITNLRPISSLPRSRPSPAAVQQLTFASLALNLIEQASFNSITPPLDTETIFNSIPSDDSPRLKPSATDLRRKYALVQHLPQGDYWTSLSADVSPATLKQLSTGHAELVAILPSALSISTDPVPTLGSVSTCPLGPTRKIAPQRRVSTAAFLDYGPWSSFAPSVDHNGEVVGQRQLAEVIYQKEVKKRLAAELHREQIQARGSIEVVEDEDVVMNGDVSEPGPSTPAVDIDAQLCELLSPEDAQAIKEAMGSLELENAVQELLERNQRALTRLEELQYRRYKNGVAGFTPVAEDSEEWETANAIMESLSTLASLRPRASGSKDLGLVPTPEVLRKLHRSLALEPNKGWHGNLPAARSTALHDDSTIKVKPPAALPAATPAAPTPVPATQSGTAAYPPYGYSYPQAGQQQQNYRSNSAYPTYKTGQATNGYYQGYNTPQQPYYSQQSYTSNQQPYGATTAQQPYSAYQSWYSQYQPPNGTSKAATPTPVATMTTYGSYYNANTTVNGNGTRTPAVANTVATKPGQTAQAQGSWPAPGQQATGVAPTLPSHLRTSQTTATTAYSPAGGYYQAYQPQAATPSAR